MKLPDMTITISRPCVACDQRWDTAGLGQLMAYHANEDKREASLCDDHAQELRESLNGAGIRWVDESMKVER